MAVIIDGTTGISAPTGNVSSVNISASGNITGNGSQLTGVAKPAVMLNNISNQFTKIGLNTYFLPSQIFITHFFPP